ncbi:MAG: tRNA (N(6)-L-threonylcarbamoyladenosine(37)-C(2))-methylthiotransferase MtaB [Acidobacteriota bacterium]
MKERHERVHHESEREGRSTTFRMRLPTDAAGGARSRRSEKFHIATFGCRTNQADSASIRADFLDRDYVETGDWLEASVIVVNSCTVTHRSDQQVRQLVRRFRRGNPLARLIVTGCYAQRDSGSIARIAGVDAVVGNSHKSQLVQLSEHLGGPRERRLSPPSYPQPAAVFRQDFSQVGAAEWTPGDDPLKERTRPFVKIQDGCDAKCAYCIIPVVRGPSRSLAPQQILRHVRDLSARGFREVVLTGIHLGTYGMHLQPRFPLHRLLEGIVAIEGLGQMRLSSIEPMELSRRVIDLAANCGGKIAPHFHICLQSGCDRTLRKMLRPYRTARFAAIVEEIREKIPEAGIGTDIIVGFPGETEEDHQQSVDFVRRMPFTYLHVFPYSDRGGTPASQMRSKVDASTIKRRSREFRRISERKNRLFRRSFAGKRLSVLTLSEEKEGMRSALSGNYLKARVDVSIPANRIVVLEVAGEEDGYLLLRKPSSPRSS